MQYPTVFWTKHLKKPNNNLLGSSTTITLCSWVFKSNVFICNWKTFNNAVLLYLLVADLHISQIYIIQIDKGNPNLSFHNYFKEVENMISSHVSLRKLENKNSNFKENFRSNLIYKRLKWLKTSNLANLLNILTQ